MQTMSAAALALLLGFTFHGDLHAETVNRQTTPDKSIAIDASARAAMHLISADEFALFRGVLAHIESARLLEDREALQQIDMRIRSALSLDRCLIQFLIRRIEHALASIPESPEP